MRDLRNRLRDHAWRHDIDLMAAVALIAVLVLAGIGLR